MAAKIRPYVPRSNIVKPHPSEEWSLDASEQDLFDSIASEHVAILGVWIELYIQLLKPAKRDALYGEITEHTFAGPYRLKAWVSYPGSDISVDEKGFTANWPGNVWMARKAIEEAGAPGMPNDGDVIRVWNRPYWNEVAIASDDVVTGIPNEGLFYTLSNLNEDGVMFNNPHFVGVTSVLVRNTSFTPERRIGDDQ